MTWSQTCKGVGVDLVWDGGEDVHVPAAMGEPREDQLRGSAHERLAELGGRACFDVETEILTRAGWSKFSDLATGTEVATVDIATGQLEWQLPIEHIQQQYCGRLYAADGTKVSIRCTPNHNLVVYTFSGRSGRLVEARSMFGQRYRIRRAAAYVGGTADSILMPAGTYEKSLGGIRSSSKWLATTSRGKDVLVDVHQLTDFASFLGFYISEGTLNFTEGVGPSVVIYQLDPSPMTEVLDRLGWRYGVQVDRRNGVEQVRIGCSALARWLLQFGKGSYKLRLPDFVFEWPIELREVLLDALMLGDGTVTKHGVRIYNTCNKLLADDVQRLIIMLGRPANINYSPGKDGATDMFRVRETKNVATVVNNKIRQDRWVDYDGLVYCVSVPNQTLVVRRRDKIMVVGNCYDSLGKGRNSDDYHKHIMESGHLSVLEHGYLTFLIGSNNGVVVPTVFRNRPGVWIQPTDDGDTWRVTCDLRAIYEFDKWTEILYDGLSDVWRRRTQVDQLALSLKRSVRAVAPRYFPGEGQGPDQPTLGWPPINDHEKWISLFMRGSRGFSHEIVRHGDFTAISQRSTRFVDEHDEAWIRHPLLVEYLKDRSRVGDLLTVTNAAETRCQTTYIMIVNELQNWMAQQPERFGTDKTGLRKQARGAARGFLGNALPTSMLFSASVWEWREIIRQRGSIYADAEIREVTCCALPELQKSWYGDRFEEYCLQDSPDGIGQIIVKSRLLPP